MPLLCEYLFLFVVSAARRRVKGLFFPFLVGFFSCLVLLVLLVFRLGREGGAASLAFSRDSSPPSVRGATIGVASFSMGATFSFLANGSCRKRRSRTLGGILGKSTTVSQVLQIEQFIDCVSCN